MDNHIKIMELQDGNPNLELFKNDITSFEQIDRQIDEVKREIAPLKEQLKQLTSLKKEAEQKIMHFMGNNNVEKCNCDRGTLIYKKTKTVVPMTKELIREELARFFASTTPSSEDFLNSNARGKAEEVYRFLYSERTYKEKETLLKRKLRS